MIFRRLVRRTGVLLQPGGDRLWLEAGVDILLQPLGDAGVRQPEVLERGEGVTNSLDRA